MTIFPNVLFVTIFPNGLFLTIFPNVLFVVLQPKQIQPPPPDAQKQTQAPPGESTATKDGGTTEDKDFFSQQARLQAEARAALAQVGIVEL